MERIISLFAERADELDFEVDHVAMEWPELKWWDFSWINVVVRSIGVI